MRASLIERLRLRHWLCLGLLVGAAASVAAYTLMRAPPPAPWVAWMDENLPRFDPVLSNTPPPFRERECFLLNDLARRPRWDVEEAGIARGLVEEGYPPLADDRGASAEYLGRVRVYMGAMLAMHGRLASGAPVTPAARRLMIEAFINEVHAEAPERQMEGAACLIECRAVDEPEARRAVEAMIRTAREDVAQSIGIMLGNYDLRKKQRQEYDARRMAAAERAGR